MIYSLVAAMFYITHYIGRGYVLYDIVFGELDVSYDILDGCLALLLASPLYVTHTRTQIQTQPQTHTHTLTHTMSVQTEVCGSD